MLYGIKKDFNYRQSVETASQQNLSHLANNTVQDIGTSLSSLPITTNLFKEFLPILTEAYNHYSGSLNASSLSPEQIDAIHEFPAKLKKIIAEMHHFIHTTLQSMQRLPKTSLNSYDFEICEAESCFDAVINEAPFTATDRRLIHKEKFKNFAFLGCPILFYKVISNLITNALHQIQEQQKGEIFINARNYMGKNYISIKDTAGGVPAHFLPLLFKGFYTTKSGGTGIGLAFCKHVMNSFGGDITCHSSYGNYIEFILEFPTFY